MRNNKRPLRLESLERRALMAGNVLATIQLGSLKIEGDSQPNDISVIDNGDGKVTIAGINGTKINGAASADLTGFTANLKMELKGGDDAVSWKGVSTHTIPRFKIETGAGNDSVAVDQLFAREGDIETGEGNDSIDLLNARAIELDLETGLGDDTVRIGRATGTIVSVSVSELEIETASGLDKVLIHNANLNSSSLEIETGSGNDSVTILKATGTSSLRVSSGFDTDTVSVEESTFRSLSIDLGAGDNDELKLTNVKSNRTRLNGGLGVGDRLTIVGPVADLGSLRQSGFEPTAGSRVR